MIRPFTFDEEKMIWSLEDVVSEYHNNIDFDTQKQQKIKRRTFAQKIAQQQD